MGIQYVTEVVASDVSTSHHQSFRVPSWAQQTMDRVLTVPQFLDTVFSIVGHTSNLLYSHLGQRSHLMCFDSMLVIFQSISSSQKTGRDRIFIDSLTRSRNFRVSKSLAIGRGFRITRGAYLYTTKQWRTSPWVIPYLTILWERERLLSFSWYALLPLCMYSNVTQEPLHDLFDVIIDACRRGFMRAMFVHRPMSAGFFYGNGYWINL